MKSFFPSNIVNLCIRLTILFLFISFTYTNTLTAQPSIEATQTDALDGTTDDGDGVAESGEGVDYEINVTNTGDADAEGVSVQLGPDANQSVDPASITTTPVGVPDSFNTPVNTQLVVDALEGVLSNDINVDGDVLTVSDTGMRTTTELGTATVNADGSFTYDPPGDFTGDDTFTYIVQDDVDGQDASTPNTTTVTITVSSNQAPSFTSGGDVDVLEDSGAYSEPWATDINPGDGEDSQTVTFNITNNDNAALFSVAPSISEDGTLSFTPADDANGSAVITVELMDDGGTAGGGDDTSDPVMFTINVNGVNDEPSFTIAGDPAAVDEDAGAQTVNGFATAISAGPSSESGQTLTFNITNNTNAGLFSAGPAVDGTTGNLTYTPADNANGSATITVELMDDGGTANGGDDTSDAQMFTITVNPVNDPPTVTGTAPSFTATGNIRIASNLLTGLTITDVDGAGTPPQPFTIMETSITTTEGGDVSVTDTSTGAFTYNPPPGFEGTDSFSFNICDSGIPLPSACTTVNITSVTVSDMIWFIDNSLGSAGDGRLTAPFNTLAAFEAANGGATMSPGNVDVIDPEAGDCIYIAENAATDYTGGLTLENTQTLVGEGANNTILNLCSITLATATDSSLTIPSTGGTRPVIVNTGGNGITLASGNTIRGLDVGTSSGTGVSGNTVGTLNITEMAVNTGSGVGVNIDTGTLNVTLDSVSVDGAANGIVLANTTGSFTVTGDGSMTNGVLDRDGSGGTIQNTTSHGISLTQTNNISLSQMDILTPGAGNLGNDTGHGIRIRNLTGSSNLVAASEIQAGNNSGDDGIEIINTDTALGEIVIENTLFNGSSTSDGFFAEARGTASNMRIVVQGGSRFTNIRGDGLQVSGGGLANDAHTIELVVQDSMFDTASPVIAGTSPGGNNGIALGAASQSTIDFEILNNTIDDVTRAGSNAGAINIITAATRTRYVGLIEGNDITSTGDQRAINIVLEGTSNTGANRGHEIAIRDNDINDTQREGIFLTVSGSQAMTGIEFDVSNNRVGTVTPVGTTTRESFEIDVFGLDPFPTHEAMFLVNNNQFVNDGDREVADMAFERNANIDLVVTGNTFTQMGTGAEEVEVDTFDSGTNLCLHLDNNTVPAGDGNEYDLDEVAGTFTVQDLANLATRNTGDIDIGVGITNASSNCSVANVP